MSKFQKKQLGSKGMALYTIRLEGHRQGWSLSWRIEARSSLSRKSCLFLCNILYVQCLRVVSSHQIVRTIGYDTLNVRHVALPRPPYALTHVKSMNLADDSILTYSYLSRPFG